MCGRIKKVKFGSGLDGKIPTRPLLLGVVVEEEKVGLVVPMVPGSSPPGLRLLPSSSLPWLSPSSVSDEGRSGVLVVASLSSSLDVCKVLQSGDAVE